MSNTVSIKLVGLTNGGRTPLDGQWLVEYDPTRPAHIVCSADPADARRFASATEAHAYWVAESGRPYPANWPLTAFAIAIEEA